MKKRRVLIYLLLTFGIIFLISFVGFVSAADGDVLWAKVFVRIGTGSNYASGQSSSTDSNNNIFVTGYFTGTFDFGGISLTSAGNEDIFVAKYNSSGGILWAQRFGGIDKDEGLSIAVYKNTGDVVVSGYFSGNITVGSDSYLSFGGKDIIVMKLSGMNGDVQWNKRIGGEYWSGSSDDIGYGVAIDQSSGNVVVAGQAAGWVNFGGGAVFTKASSLDSVLIKYSSSGQYLWAKNGDNWGSLSVDSGRAVAVNNNGDIILAGVTQGPIILEGSTLSTSGPYTDIYVAKFNSTGGHIWSEGFGNDWATGVGGAATDIDGNILLTGSFSQTLNFGTEVITATASSGYLVKFRGDNGLAIWSKVFVASAGSAGLGIAADSSKSVIVTGFFYTNGDFGGGNLISVGLLDGFVAKYNSSGGYVWAKRFGGAVSDFGNGVAVNNNGDAIVTGYINNGDFLGINLNTNGATAGFLAKIQGNQTIVQNNYHPADSNKNWGINNIESLNYTVYYKSQNPWPIAPSQITNDFQVLQRFLYKSGEVYHYLSGTCPPSLANVCWAAGI